MTTLTYSKASNVEQYFAVPNISKIIDGQEKVFLRVTHKRNYYEEISNEKSFNEYDLFCQLGGIIGIMLGFSFLQLPLLASKTSLMLKSVLQNSRNKVFAG